VPIPQPPSVPGPPGLGSPARWIDPPRLRVDNSESRHATWLELFFDLVFVAAVAQTATELSHELNPEGFARYAATFFPVVWAWVGFAVYANRFDTDDAVFRVTMAGGMLAVAALAVAAPNATSSDAQAFAFAIVGVRAILVALYARAYRHIDGVAREGAKRFVIGFSIGAALWLASAFVDSPERFVLWGLGFGVELATPILTWRTLAGGVAPLHVQHVEERFGLFTIIVLGESVLAVVTGIGVASFDFTASVTAAAALAIAVAVWWIYFDLADTSVIRGGMRGFIYIYGHLFLYAGVAALGVGSKVAIEAAGGAGELEAGARWALCAGLALFLICLAVLHAAVRTRLRDSIMFWRLGAAAALCLLAAFGGALAPLAFVAAATAIALTQLFVEATCSRIDCATPLPEFEMRLTDVPAPAAPD
jgi:low temperature requirement protein LtrA